MKRHKFRFFLVLMGLFLMACRPYWKENPDNFLLTKIKAVPEPHEHHGKNSALKKHNMDKALYPYLNKKIFGLRFYLALYEWGDHANLEKEIEVKHQKLAQKEIVRQRKYEEKKTKWFARKHKKQVRLYDRGYDTVALSYKPYKPKKYQPTFKEWLTTVAGEPPVLVDSSQIEQGVKKLGNFLFTSGFFENKVRYEIKYDLKKQKAQLYYFVTADKPHLFNEVEYAVEDSVLQKYIVQHKHRSLIERGRNFDISVLEAERKRIYELLYNKGYYEITPEHIIYEADTSVGEHKVDLVLSLQPNKIYQPYHYDHINVFLNIAPAQKDDPGIHLREYKGYHFYYYPKGKKQHMPYKPNSIIRSLQIKKGDIFSNTKISAAVNRLMGPSDIGVFQYIDYDLSSSNPQGLNLNFYLSSAKKNSFMTELNGTLRGQNLGATFVVGLTYKNIFRGAEKLHLQFSGGVESQAQITDSPTASSWKNYVPNTYQVNPQVTLQLPEILFPFSGRIFKNSLYTQTSLLFSFDLQQQPAYLRTNSKISFFYQWRSGLHPFLSHSITVAELTYTNFTNKSDAFIDRLDKLKDRYLKALFENYFIPISAYNLTIEKGSLLEPQASVVHNYMTFESSGNILRGIAARARLPQDFEGGYQIAQVTFTQYVKFFNDLRYYYNINQKSSFAFRQVLGVILPLPNSKIIPFEKSFYVGGTNDLRAWNNYALGPGASFDTIQNYDKVGDIKLLFSAEYRFNVFSYLDMALFADAGNIWLMNKNENYKNGEFRWTDFYRQIALAVGIGVRLNFNNYFIFRVDVAFPFYDPSYFEGEKWIWDSKRQYNAAIREYNLENGTKLNPYSYVPNFNIGIGYPF